MENHWVKRSMHVLLLDFPSLAPLTEERKRHPTSDIEIHNILVCLPVGSLVFTPALDVNPVGWLNKGKNGDWKIQLGDVCGKLLPL